MREDLAIETVDEVADFDRIAGSMIRRIEALGVVDYGAVRSDLKALSQPISDSVDPAVLAKDLNRIQAFKDRAVEIVRFATDVYLTYKRVVEVLTGGWPRYSSAKSAESREGEAKLKFANIIMAANEAESVYRYAIGVMRNLESQQENVFKQISCAQVSSRLGQRPWVDNVTDWGRFDDQQDGPAADGGASHGGQS